jgi:hypothetical protein
MNKTKLNWKRYLRLVPELLVIFLSVLLAFFVEDYRESKNEESQYKSDLVIFRLELISEINDLNFSLDSFRVSQDDSHRGALYKQLVKQLWLDSLIRRQKATTKDFRFVIETTELIPKPEPIAKSPLPEEIRTKYDEHIRSTRTIKWLRVYLQEKGVLEGMNRMLYDGGNSLSQLLQKTNPNLEFDRRDSALFYSNEFIWNYRSMVSARKQQYLYSKRLAQKRLIDVLDGINEELDELGVSVPSDSCVRANYRQRFICEHKRPINDSDSLITIQEEVIRERKKYFAELAGD